MVFWNSRAITATRKLHTCVYCGRVIPVGSSCRSEAGIFEGNFDHYYLCERCVYFMDTFADNQYDELLGNFVDELFNTNLLDCPKCSKFNSSICATSNDKQNIELECGSCGHNWRLELSLEALQNITTTANK